MPKLEKAKTTKAFKKKLSIQEKPTPISLHLKSDLRIQSTIDETGPATSILQNAPFFVTQPHQEAQDSLYENVGRHSFFDVPDKTQITEDITSVEEEGNDYKDVGIAAKVHAAHLESQNTCIHDSYRAFARISHKMKSKYMDRLSD